MSAPQEWPWTMPPQDFMQELRPHGRRLALVTPGTCVVILDGQLLVPSGSPAESVAAMREALAEWPILAESAERELGRRTKPGYIIVTCIRADRVAMGHAMVVSERVGLFGAPVLAGVA